MSLSAVTDVPSIVMSGCAITNELRSKTNTFVFAKRTDFNQFRDLFWASCLDSTPFSISSALSRRADRQSPWR
jgi:hypothetical protein